MDIEYYYLMLYHLEILYGNYLIMSLYNKNIVNIKFLILVYLQL